MTPQRTRIKKVMLFDRQSDKTGADRVCPHSAEAVQSAGVLRKSRGVGGIRGEMRLWRLATRRNWRHHRGDTNAVSFPTKNQRSLP